MIKVAIVGYGNLGKYLTNKILASNKFEIMFIWNRTEITDENLDKKYILKNLDNFVDYELDLIIEVSHPIISEKYALRFLEKADYVVGSPTALSNQVLLSSLLEISEKYKHKIFVPCGAFWGVNDIKKMDEKKTLKGLKITMKKHPESLKLEGSLKDLLDGTKFFSDSIILYDGPVRTLCQLAPNNVNTMAVAALVAQNLGFDNVIGCLIADKKLSDRHIIEIEVTGPYNENLKEYFKCYTIRSNPAHIGQVTGTQTYESFFYSLLEILGKENQYGIIVC